MITCNAVLAGGGVKGIGHVGAISALEQNGYVFDCVAGSSAGAIVASLIAAGYRGEEMHDLMKTVDYLKFKEEGLLDHIGVIGKGASVLFDYGIYSAEYLETWLNALLMKRNACCFKDVLREDGTYALQVTTVDLTTQELLVLPQDLARFHIDINSFPIARAVRMSMSIPFFYQPYELKDMQGRTHYLVDGGLLSNYPMWILDDGEMIQQPIFGFRLINETTIKKEATPCDSILDYLKLLISTLLDAGDHIPISNTKGDQERSILIPSNITIDGVQKNISTTDFEISEQESEALYQNGLQAGREFLAHWNFQDWLKKYREPSRTEE